MSIRYKKGPHNTLRAYDSHNGQYVNDFSKFASAPKIKISSKEKEELRKEEVYQSANKSKDKNVFETYLILEGLRPGCVKHINCKVLDKFNKKERELDIVTDKAIYEVKSGKAKHRYKQYSRQKKYAQYINKDHVVFSPGSSNTQIKILRRMGINIYNDINEFIEMEKKRKWKI